MPLLHVVADLGNTRLKWGLVSGSGAIECVTALPADDPASWRSAWPDWKPGRAAEFCWSVSSVNPPAARALRSFLEELGVTGAKWYESAASVEIRHALRHAETAGADRALAVSAASAARAPGTPGLVVLCGTAVTVERVDAEGTWRGGAIAAGLTLTGRALHMLTAQLPEVCPHEAPPAWGDATRPALEAGVFWGVVGAIRELLTRQSADLIPTPWVTWTGGDAATLAPAVGWPGAAVVPDLVLQGLGRLVLAKEAEERP